MKRLPLPLLMAALGFLFSRSLTANNVSPTHTRITVRKAPTDTKTTAPKAALPEGVRLKVHTALRTTEIQSRGYWGHYKNLQEKHPAWPKSTLRREANKFWHPPDVPKAPPGHCTGGAVDVGLVDLDGNAIDTTSVSREGADAIPTYALYLTPEAKANRTLHL